MTEPKEPLIVDVDLKELDLQRANFWYRLGSGRARFNIAILLVAGLLILWRFGTADLFANPPIAVVIVVAPILPVLYPLLIWYQTKRGFANLQGFQRTIQYSFSPSGHSVQDAKSSALCPRLFLSLHFNLVVHAFHVGLRLAFSFDFPEVVENFRFFRFTFAF
jgi:hypothetical protein